MWRELWLIVQTSAVQLPAPRGFVNDFAGVIPAAVTQRMEGVLREVRDKTGGDIAVVTLPDLGGHSAGDVALQIGRQWKLGGTGEAGDPARNLGVVVLVVPSSHDIFIATGRGAEGFLPDGRVGRIRDAMVPSLARGDYGAGIETGVNLLAQAFANEFHVTLSGPAAPPSAEGRPLRPGAVAGIVALVILVLIFRGMAGAALMGGGRGRRGRSWWGGGGWGGGGWSGGGFGGWGGGGGGGGSGGGGFGGFGGGGGFSGGGAGGKF